MDLRSLLRRFGGAPGAGGGPAGGPAGETERAARSAWRDLPPISRVVRSAPLVARSVDFRHEVSDHLAAPLVLAPLGHEVHRDAPAGVAGGIATVSHAPGHGTEHGALSASVRRRGQSIDRRPAHEPARLASTAVARSADAETPSSAEAVADDVPDAPIVARSVSVTAPAAPRRTMTAVTGTTPLPPPGRIGRAQIAGTAPAVSVPVAPQANESTPVSPIVSMAADAPRAVGASSPPARTESGPRPAGQTRRIRIGAPLDGRSSEFRLVGRSATPDEPAIERTEDPTESLSVRGPIDRGSASSAPGDGEEVSPGPTAEAGSGTSVVARSVDHTAPETAASPSAPAEPPVPAQLSPAPPPSAVRPLVGGLKTIHVDRAPAALPPSPAVVQTESPGGPVSAARPSLGAIVAGLAAGSPVGSDPGGSPAAGPSSAFPLPPTVARDATSWSAAPTTVGDEPGPPTIARSISAPPVGVAASSWQPQVRRVVATTPARIGATRTGAAGSSPAPGPASHLAATATVAQRQPAQRSAESTAEATPTAATAWTGDGAPDANPEPDAAGQPVQRSFDDAAEPSDSAPAVTLAPMVSRQADDAGGGGGTAGGGGATPGAGSEKELDELARKLFPRLQIRLRSELLVDRERIGSLVDFGR